MSGAAPDKKITTWTTKQVVFVTIFVVCVFLIFWLLYSLRLLIFLFFAAIVIGTAIRPGVGWLHRRGISRPAGILIIYLLIAGFLAGFFYLVLPLLADQVTQVSKDLPGYYAELRRSLANSSNRLVQIIGVRLPLRLTLFGRQEATTSEMIDQAAQTFLYLNLILKGLFSVLAIFLLAYYWTQEGSRVTRAFIRMLPASRRDAVRDFIQVAEFRIGGYIRGQGTLSLIVGVAAFVAYSLIGLPFALVLSIIAGIMEMVPVFGPALGAIPAFLVALSVDPQKAMWVLAVTAIIQVVENAFLVPRIMNNSMGVNPIIILLSLVAFGSVLGFAGALLALPLAAIIQLLIDRIVLPSDAPNQPPQRIPNRFESLLDETRDVRRSIVKPTDTRSVFNTLSAPDRSEIRNIVDELDGLLDQLDHQDV